MKIGKITRKYVKSEIISIIVSTGLIAEGFILIYLFLSGELKDEFIIFVIFPPALGLLFFTIFIKTDELTTFIDRELAYFILIAFLLSLFHFVVLEELNLMKFSAKSIFIGLIYIGILINIPYYFLHTRFYRN